MVKNEKGELSVAGIIALIVAAVASSVQYPTANFDIIGYFGVEGDLMIHLFSAFIGIISGLIVHFVFSRLIRIDEI